MTKQVLAERRNARQRLLDILSVCPELKGILLDDSDLHTKRKRLRAFLSRLQMTTFDDNPRIPPLEWILTRDAISVFRGILSKRSERLTGFSFLAYICDLLSSDEGKLVARPSRGFFAEFEHLLRGITGQTGVYAEKAPSFGKYQGAKAARLRSEDLSRMAREATGFVSRYPWGLDDELRRRRSRNRTRILRFFGAGENDWRQWRWHTRHLIKDAETLSRLVELSPEEYEAVRLAREHRVPFGITPYYVSLMNRESGGDDAAVRAQVIPSLHYVRSLNASRSCSESSMDFMLERDTSPIEGITRRYPKIVILKPFMTCPQICVYCQRNWEIEDVHSYQAALPAEKIEKALQWIDGTPEITEVLITGGDPLIMSERKFLYILSRLAKNPRIERIRIGTRTPVTLPQRITEETAEAISRFHTPGRREVMIVTHFEHTSEITPDAVDAVQKFRRRGIDVYNQLVYTFYNSRRFEAAALRSKLRLAGVTPYYTFNTKGKEETDDFRVPISRLIQEQKEEARLMPGSERTDEIVFNVPGLGKNYLRAVQHHDVISILPDGRRVYEFHPWEKKLALVDTYVYIDVSIYDYLKRLRAVGENPRHYRSIWYYY